MRMEAHTHTCPQKGHLVGEPPYKEHSDKQTFYSRWLILVYTHRWSIYRTEQRTLLYILWAVSGRCHGNGLENFHRSKVKVIQATETESTSHKVRIHYVCGSELLIIGFTADTNTGMRRRLPLSSTLLGSTADVSMATTCVHSAI